MKRPHCIYLGVTLVSSSVGCRILQVVKVYVELVWDIHLPGKCTGESKRGETNISTHNTTNKHRKLKLLQDLRTPNAIECGTLQKWDSGIWFVKFPYKSWICGGMIHPDAVLNRFTQKERKVGKRNDQMPIILCRKKQLSLKG